MERSGICLRKHSFERLKRSPPEGERNELVPRAQAVVARRCLCAGHFGITSQVSNAASDPGPVCKHPRKHGGRHPGGRPSRCCF